jgi:hypothetical protein
MEMVNVTPRPRFTRRKKAPLPIVQEAGWASEPVWTQSIEENSFCFCRGSNPSSDLPVRSQTLYWLSYLVSLLIWFHYLLLRPYSPNRVLSSLKFLILFTSTVGLLWTRHQPVAKASVYTGQHNTETQKQISMPRAGFKPMILVTKRPPGPVIKVKLTNIKFACCHTSSKHSSVECSSAVPGG